MPHTPAIEHPPWCDDAECTAQPQPTRDEYKATVDAVPLGAPIPLGTRLAAGDFGTHRSAEIDVGCGISLQLTEAVAPWKCSTYIHVRDTNAQAFSPHISPAYTMAERMLGALVNLFGGINAEPCTEPGKHRDHTYDAGNDLFLWCPGRDEHGPAGARR